MAKSHQENEQPKERIPFKVFEDTKAAKNPKKKVADAGVPMRSSSTKIQTEIWHSNGKAPEVNIEYKDAAAQAKDELAARQKEYDEVLAEKLELAETNTRLREKAWRVTEQKENLENEIEALTEEARKVYSITKAMEDKQLEEMETMCSIALAGQNTS